MKLNKIDKTEVNEIKRKIKNEQEVRISERALKVEQDQTLHTLNRRVIRNFLEQGSFLGIRAPS